MVMSSCLEFLPPEVVQHVGYTAVRSIVVVDESGSPPLNFLYLCDVVLVVGIRYNAPIFQDGSYKRRVYACCLMVGGQVLRFLLIIPRTELALPEIWLMCLDHFKSSEIWMPK